MAFPKKAAVPGYKQTAKPAAKKTPKPKGVAKTLGSQFMAEGAGC